MTSAAEALVLTEWKVVGAREELSRKIVAAKHQAQQYGRGSLAGIELSDTRYLVMVSEDVLDMPPDEVEEGITYRHIGIAVNPSSPSKSARRSR